MHKHDGSEYLPISLDADAEFHLTNVHGINLRDGAASVHNRLHALEADRAITLDEVTALRAKVAELEASVEARRGEVTFAQQQATDRARDLDRFKEQVRDRVIEAKDKYDLCDTGTEWFLDALGLPGLKRDFTVRVPCTLTYEVEATSESDALEQVKYAYGLSEADDYDIDWYSAEANES